MEVKTIKQKDIHLYLIILVLRFKLNGSLNIPFWLKLRTKIPNRKMFLGKLLIGHVDYSAVNGSKHMEQGIHEQVWHFIIK